MTFDEWRKGVSEKTGAEMTAEDDVCVAEIDGASVVFRHLPETNELLTMAEIGVPQPGAAEPTAMVMMAGNRLFVATGGAALARNAETGSFELVRRDPIDVLPFERWWPAFTAFVDALFRWRKFVADYHPGAAEPQPDAPAFGLPDFMQV